MDLDLDITLGEPPLPHPLPRVISIAELTDEDLEERLSKGAGGQTKSLLKKIRNSHHELARLVALGNDSPEEMARLTGYTIGTIGQLCRDPSFAQLVSHYTEMKMQTATLLDVRRLEVVAADAVDELHDLVKGEGQKPLTAAQLKEIAFGLLDRIGHGPSRTEHQHKTTTDLTPQEIERVRNAAKDKDRAHDAEFSDVPDAPRGEESREPAVVGSVRELPALGDEADRVAGGGPSVREERGSAELVEEVLSR